MRSYGARRLNLPRADAFEFRANYWQSQNIALSYLSGTPFQLEFPTANFFRQAFIQGGAAIRFDGIERRVTNGETCILPPETLVTAAFSPGFEHFGLRIKAESLLSKLAALTDSTPSRKLEFNQVTRADHAAIGNLRRMLMFFATELDSGMPALAITELEQALIVSFICSNRHNYSALLQDRTRSIASWQVRRAEEYIEAHWKQPITIEELVRVTSVSARSIFYQFKKDRGQSPMAFVKQVRLRHARDMLERADVSVTETAYACGFSNLGHFARDYFNRFNELPSETIKRSKR
jgi:AraC-like DNA-binding protein